MNERAVGGGVKSRLVAVMNERAVGGEIAIRAQSR